MSVMSRITENTSIPLKVVVAIITATIVISAQLFALKNELQQISGKLDGTWTVQNMELWTTKLGAANPTLKVPDAREAFAIKSGKKEIAFENP